MAERSVTRSSRDDRVEVFTWAGLVGSADNGEGIFVGNLIDLTVQAVGDFNSAAVTIDIEGSQDDTNYGAVQDEGASDIALGDETIKLIRGNPLYIRPNGSAGAGGDVDVIITGKKYR